MARKALGVCVIFLLVLGCCLTCFALIPAFAEEGLPEDQTAAFVLKLRKVDQGTGLPVGGAEFLLSREDGTYLTGEETPLWTKAEGEARTLVTHEDGTFTVEGLPPGSYYLTETKAPNGYELLGAPVRIVVTAEYALLGNGVREVTGFAVQCEGGQVCSDTGTPWDLVEIRVENAYGTVLPATGGMGTAIYYLFGMVVLFVAALFVVAKRLLHEQ